MGEETDEYDNDECKVDYVMAERRWENAKIVTMIPSKNNSITGMEGHEDLRVAKKVTCVYFKKSDKKSKDLPDTDCRQEIRSPQEMMLHVQEEHPWLNWTEETSKKHFEEEIKATRLNALM